LKKVVEAAILLDDVDDVQYLPGARLRKLARFSARAHLRGRAVRARADDERYADRKRIPKQLDHAAAAIPSRK
jgi:hypothetical protein